VVVSAVGSSYVKHISLLQEPEKSRKLATRPERCICPHEVPYFKA